MILVIPPVYLVICLHTGKTKSVTGHISFYHLFQKKILFFEQLSFNNKNYIDVFTLSKIY